MRKLGVKLWSRNVVECRPFFDDVMSQVKKGMFDYVELFAFPGMYEQTAKVIAEQLEGVPAIIHNSHSGYGFDAGNKERLADNIRDIDEAKRFADMLNAEIIVVHAGCGVKPENIDETIRQFKIFNDSRIAVENLPPMDGKAKLELHGRLPEEISRIMDETGCKFCLDFSHATCSANKNHLALDDVLNDFMRLKPCMFHLCDGFTDELDDSHLHFGKGNYNLKKIVQNYIPDNAFVTMETGGRPVSADLWLADRDYFRHLEN